MKTLVHVSKGCIQAATHRRDCHINEVESLTYYAVGEAEAFAWSLLDAVEVMRGREPTQEQIDAELGADHYKGEKAL